MKKETTFILYLLMLFLNAFVDLGHKITIQNTVFKVYDGQMQIILIGVVNSLILLPFILLFTPAAHFSNRYPLVRVMRATAWVALGCTILITWFYYQGNYRWAFAMTLVLAMQSAIYSPAKYGYIKQLMGEAGLVAANARVQVATIVAILSGTLVFSILFETLLKNAGLQSGYTESAILQVIAPLGWLLVASTLLELFTAYRLTDTGQGAGTLRFDWRAYLQGRKLKAQLAVIHEKPAVYYSILGLSLFWGLSQMVLAAFPAYAKQHLAEHNVALIQGLLACSGLGIFCGSLLVRRIARRTYAHPLADWQLRKQMIPFGGLGITLSLLLIPQLESRLLLALGFFGIGAFGAYFIVPLNAIIQSQTRPGQVGTVLAGNNWIQNISMLGFLALTIVSALTGLDSVWLFYLMIVIAGTCLVLYLRYGLRDLMQFIILGLFRLRYRITLRQREEFPAEEGVLMLGNHVSWIDWAILQAVIPRPIRFVIDRSYYEHWSLFRFLRHIGTVPISPRRSKEAIRQIGHALRENDVICLFPEGHISHDGELKPFKSGYELSLRDTEANIVPFHIHGMSGSRLSRVGTPRSTWRDILMGHRRELLVSIGPALHHVSADELYTEICQLRDQAIVRQPG